MRCRRSARVRRVKPDPVDDALVLRLIELALKAPTQQNSQAWEFIVVKDAAVKARLGAPEPPHVAALPSDRGVEGAKRSEGAAPQPAVEWGVDHFEEIPVFVVACIRGPRIAFPPILAASTYGSIFPSIQNLLLAARAVGLGANLDHDAALEQLRRASHPRAAVERDACAR